MNDQTLLITNALICNEGRVVAGDVLIRRAVSYTHLTLPTSDLV